MSGSSTRHHHITYHIVSYPIISYHTWYHIILRSIVSEPGITVLLFVNPFLSQRSIHLPQILLFCFIPPAAAPVLPGSFYTGPDFSFPRLRPQRTQEKKLMRKKDSLTSASSSAGTASPAAAPIARLPLPRLPPPYLPLPLPSPASLFPLLPPLVTASAECHPHRSPPSSSRVRLPLRPLGATKRDDAHGSPRAPIVRLPTARRTASPPPK